MSIVSEEESNIEQEKESASRGDVLLTSEPFAYVLKGSLRGTHCEACLKKKGQGLQRCSGCGIIYYCNRECQKSSWDVHKQECANLKKLKPKYPPDTARLIARVIFRLQKDGQDYSEKVHNNQSRKFKDLMNHYRDVKEDPIRQEHFNSLVQVLKKYIGEENLPNGADLLGIYGRILVNSYTITDKDMNAVGTGVYLAGSVFDHSCKPNAYASFNKTQLVVHSLVHWPQLDFTKVRISYIDALNTTKHRRNELKEGYYFLCDCRLCQDKEKDKICSSVACGNKSCSAPVPILEGEVGSSIGPCPSCGFSDFDEEMEHKYFEMIKLTDEKLNGMKDTTLLDVCQHLLKQQGSLLHPLNIWRVRTLDAAFEAAVDLRNWESALEYGCSNLEGLKYYCGANHPMFAMCLLKMGKIELYLFKFSDALRHLKEAEPILRVSHGTDSPLYREDMAPLLKQAKQEIAIVQNNGFSVYKKKPTPPQSNYRSLAQ